MHLGRVEAFIVLSNPPQRLVKRTKSVLELAERAECVGQQRQEPGPYRAYAGSPTAVHRLTDVGDTRVRVPLLHGSPSAGQQAPQLHCVESVLDRYRYRLVCACPCRIGFATELKLLGCEVTF